ncbi:MULTISPECIES: DUF1453 family protein [Streptomyces]|uniref:DUF1453 family protein n=1 Tax=Streptomyces celluloflavus TaxID=58344 RepID=A0ABW7RJW4_9ACTN|nr:DUF1453 family protein [Streptomyces sp. SID7805]MYU52004.1 DUF1453 family protein [Streptomyces sp. SID7805]WSK15485.1 DUF1453 family protein [Streptomyces celluloflavus]
MSGLMNILVIVAVVAIIFARQFKERRITTDNKRWWLLPVVLAVVALREPGLLDPSHHTAAAVLLAAQLVIGLAGGAAWAWTTRMWTDGEGAVWTKGGWATAGVWIVSMALRIGLFAVGAPLGIHQGGPATMLSIAAMLLTRTGVTAWRAQSLRPAYRVPVAG